MFMNSPFVMIIFGATGDLAKNKLIPSLFSLFKKKQLGELFYIVGFSRRDMNDAEYAAFLKDAVRDVALDAEWEQFVKNIYYQIGFFDQKEGYERLVSRLNQFDEK